MPLTVIEACDISKKYCIGKGQDDSIRGSISNLLKRADRSEEFWALRNISFEIEQGDIVGIVGRNGAGKSTLLKILSRITYPTEGFIKYTGKIASLLEVGTGFHPELTGRENIYMNGTLLGMTRKEVKSRLSEIIDFSGIEQFIDTPVKHFSSGMYVRLAFSVAAHLEPDILVIDEVLAVGDVDFQKKCLGKMDEVSKKKGRTVLFVSHNISAVNNLCNTGILLEKGKIKSIDRIQEVTRLYLSGDRDNEANQVDFTSEGGAGDEYARVISVKVLDTNGDLSDFYKIDEEVVVEVIFAVKSKNCNPVASFHFYTAEGEKIFITLDTDKTSKKLPGMYRSYCRIPANFFNVGTYIVGISLATISPLINHYIQYTLLTIRILDNPTAITRNNYSGTIGGAIRPLFPWMTEKIE